LLPKASSFLNPGGILVFATCSMQFEEGSPRIEKFIDNTPHFSLISNILSGELGNVLGLDDKSRKEGTLRTLPFFLDQAGGMDGFYIAALKNLSD